MNRMLVTLTAMAALLTAPALAVAQTQDDVMGRINALERQLEELKSQVSRAEGKADKASTSADEVYSKWHLSGYFDTSFVVNNGGGDASFTRGKFAPVIHYQYKDLVLFEGELEFEVEEDGSTKATLEYAAVNLMLHDNFILVAGQYLSPIGQFQERLHPSWINKLPSAPAGFGHGGAQPLSDVGLQVRGAVAMENMQVTYVGFVGNGPRLGAHGPELEAFGGDDNGNKSFGGRIAFLPKPYIEIGASFMTAGISGGEKDGAVDQANYRLWGADFSFTKGPWDVRAEYLHSRLKSLGGEHQDEEEDHGEAEAGHDEAAGGHDEAGGGDAHGPAGLPGLIPGTNWTAWYAQAAYQFSGVTSRPFLRNLEAVARYSELRIDGFDEFAESAEERINVGLNYLFTPSLIAKAAVERRNWKDPGKEDTTGLMLQISYGF